MTRARRVGFDVLADPRVEAPPPDPNFEAAGNFTNYGRHSERTRALDADGPHVRVERIQPPISDEQVAQIELRLERPLEANVSWGRENYMFVRSAVRAMLRMQ